MSKSLSLLVYEYGSLVEERESYDHLNEPERKVLEVIEAELAVVEDELKKHGVDLIQGREEWWGERC